MPFDINCLPETVSASLYSLQFVNIYLEHVIGLARRVRVRVSGVEMNVEAGVANVFQQCGFDVVSGENIYYASFNRKSPPPEPEARDLFMAFANQFPDVAKLWTKWGRPRTDWLSGVPDLFLWNKQTQQWFWAEVKSGGDNLRVEQWRWLQEFQAEVSPNVCVIRVLAKPYAMPTGELTNYIFISPELHNGVPCLRCGIKVSYAINQVARGKSEELIKSYGLTQADLQAALAYVQEQSKYSLSPMVE